MEDYPLKTDTPPEDINVNDTAFLVNSNCEFSYDNITGYFQEDLLYCIICDLEFIDSDLSEYRVEKSCNGGCYAYARARIKRIKEITY